MAGGQGGVHGVWVCEPVLQAGEDNGANRTHKEPDLIVMLRVVDV